MKKILFINACVRSNSRTKQLAAYVLGKLDGEVQELRLEDMKFPEVNEEFLADRERKSSSESLVMKCSSAQGLLRKRTR